MWTVDYNITHPNDGYQVPFYWILLSHNPYFVQRASNRYEVLRRTVLHKDSLFARIDYWTGFTEAARIRNFEKWPRSEKQPYSDEVVQMKDWISDRLDWMDTNFSLLTGRDQVQDSNVFSLEPNYPNPFNRFTTLTFTLPFAWPVRLQVFSVTGRLIRTLIDADKQAMRHTVGWDGRDEKGRRVSSGLYIARFGLGPEHRTIRMILIR